MTRGGTVRNAANGEEIRGDESAVTVMGYKTARGASEARRTRTERLGTSSDIGEGDEQGRKSYRSGDTLKVAASDSNNGGEGARHGMENGKGGDMNIRKKYQAVDTSGVEGGEGCHKVSGVEKILEGVLN